MGYIHTGVSLRDIFRWIDVENVLLRVIFVIYVYIPHACPDIESFRPNETSILTSRILVSLTLGCHEKAL